MNKKAMKQIFPIEILENTTIVHQFKHNKKSAIIYMAILTLLIVTLTSLPYIKIDIYTSASGLLKPTKERLTLTLNSSGKVLKSNIEANKYVNKGDTLLLLDHQHIESKLTLIRFNIKETKRYIHDAQFLIKWREVQPDSLQSKKYQKEYLQYLQKLKELQTRNYKEKRDYLRNQQLFFKGVISAVALENSKFDYDLAINAISQLRNNQYNSWQHNLSANLKQLKELENKHQIQNENKELYILTAPSSGTLINVIGVEEGSLIRAGMNIGEISPDGNLIVECYISPTDIGLLNIENQVNYQIDAFNYNHWGLATGKIVEIGKDIEIINETPVFKVRCTIDQSYLSLKNNYKGFLSKGMTLNARFKIAERTLFELLYDNFDDWLNPSSQMVN
jgi:HlyD family secretion protein